MTASQLRLSFLGAESLWCCPVLYLRWTFMFHSVVDPTGNQGDLQSTLCYLVSPVCVLGVFFLLLLFLMVLCYRQYE